MAICQGWRFSRDRVLGVVTCPGSHDMHWYADRLSGGQRGIAKPLLSGDLSPFGMVKIRVMLIQS